MPDARREERIFIFAPTGKDGALTAKVLGTAGIESLVCATGEQVLHEMDDALGALLLVEEALTKDFVADLSRRIFDQPNWSDLPVLLLTSVGASSPALRRPIQMLGNVTLLERPVRTVALISAAGAALRARRRQYGVREADQRKDEFLASLGHELRNPLAPIRTGASILSRTYPDAPDVKRVCGIVERQVTHLTRLVDDLLDVARITRGKVELQRAPTTLAAIVNQAVEMSASLAENAGHELAVTLPPEEVALVADHARMVQAVANIIANAIKFTPRPGRIVVDSHADNGHVVVRVKDPGIGIDPNALTHIFGLFAQAEVGAAQVKAGLGIGLALTKQFVEMHGGRVVAYSAGLGQGSELVVTLPRDPAQAGERRATRAAYGRARRSAAHIARVLVVDDNRDAADMLLSLFRSHGYIATCAYNGEDAVREAVSSAPDVIVMDLAMPMMNGYEAARRIRQEQRGHRPILIALTGWGQEGSRRKSIDAGFDFHAVKPVDIELLKNFIAQSPLRSGVSATG